MSQYNTASYFAADNAGWGATDPDLAPFLPTMNQSGDLNPPAHAGAGQSVASAAALPPAIEFMPLHGRAEITGKSFDNTCATCLASFPTNHQLERHAAKNEIKHKAYLCTCGKGFTKSSALRRHAQEFTQDREHQCPLCDHKCKRPGHVEQHLRLIHKKSKDEIKDLLSNQKSEPHQGPEQSSTASAAVPTTGSMATQAGYPVAVPGGPWTGPIGFSATARVDHPGSRPGDSSALFSGLPALGAGQVTTTPTFAPQSFMTQTAGSFAYSAFPADAAAAQTGFFTNPAPDVVSYPAGPLDGTDNLFNVNPASVIVNPIGGFEMPALETEFVGEFYDFDLNSFGNI